HSPQHLAVEHGARVVHHRALPHHVTDLEKRCALPRGLDEAHHVFRVVRGGLLQQHRFARLERLDRNVGHVLRERLDNDSVHLPVPEDRFRRVGDSHPVSLRECLRAPGVFRFPDAAKGDPRHVTEDVRTRPHVGMRDVQESYADLFHASYPFFSLCSWMITEMMMTRPVTTYCPLASTWRRFSPFPMIPRSSTPVRVPQTFPRPPVSGIPPM